MQIFLGEDKKPAWARHVDCDRPAASITSSTSGNRRVQRFHLDRRSATLRGLTDANNFRPEEGLAAQRAQLATWKLLTAAFAAAGLLASGARSHPSAQTAGPIAAYAFSEGTGTTVADASGNNLTGTVVGATWTTGRYGNALRFNGTSNYVDLGNPAALQLTGSMTIEAWVNAAANPPDDGQIVAKSNGSGWEFKTSPDTGPHTFGIAVSPTSSSHTQRYSTTVRNLNTWYHVAGVYDTVARTLTTYTNGALDNGVLNGTVPADWKSTRLNS